MNWPPSAPLIKQLRKAIKHDLAFPDGWRTKMLRRRTDDPHLLYINRELGLLVKAPRVIIGHETEGLTLPTIGLNFGWVLQPLCTFKDRKVAYAIIKERLKDRPGEFDLHYWNVGWWNGKAWLFDW